ncbi:hypothetical protein BP6252_02150 [Coleophoma cylindrospora]|uniref:Uncharacterized protein n=1 Tax=Coleophoma cylindrospora TaxID=1849047 RepID=A0A3D8SE03_9HELO|nr:hypothetical protein BP6252_02150 [Coleophoma cylindrospora]
MHKHPLPSSAPEHLVNKSASSPSSPSSSSSQQRGWAEDHCADDYAGELTENRFEDTGDLPATLPSTSLPQSVPSTSDGASCQTRTHKRSLTALLPFQHRTFSQSALGSASGSPQRSPEKERLDFDLMPLTGDKDANSKAVDKSKGGISSWFTGTSAPVSVGIPITEGAVDETEQVLQKRPTLTTLESTSNSPKSAVSRFNFFAAKTPAAKTVQIPANMEDEYINLDINAALFPSGAPSDRDPFSPAAFKNLLMNAEGLLLKLQTAYKIRSLSLHEMAAEKEAQAEELEQAEMRAKHLKIQLEDMGKKLEAQDAAVTQMATELAHEKQARAAEKEAREKSIALVKFNREEIGMLGVHNSEEDLGVSTAPRKQKWRKSHNSSELSAEGDSDLDDDMSGGGESVFSRSLSPTFVDSSATSIMTLESTPEIQQAAFGRVVPNQNPPSNRPLKPVQQPSTFQKILKGIVPVDQLPPTKEEGGGIGLEEGCSNCRGKDSSVAWDAVGLLRMENKGLKDRVGELEIVVDGAMDLCSGIGFDFNKRS